jgi:O-methyltransferase
VIKRAVNGLLRPFGLQLLRSHTYRAALENCRALGSAAEESETRGREATERARTLEGRLLELKAKLDRAEARNDQLTRQLFQERDLTRTALEQLRQARGAAPDPGPGPAAPAPAAAGPESHDAAHWTRLGEEAQRHGEVETAIAHYGRAMGLIHGYGPARARMLELSQSFTAKASRLLDDHDGPGAKRALVRAVELNPLDAEARAALDGLIARGRPYDLTKQCFVHIDPERGKAMYKEAFLRAYEYVTAAGLLGDVMEFGVLSGFTARLQCEIMRDLMIWKDVHLFDSFEGLPDYTSAVDRESYDIAVRNVWADRMRFPDEFVRDNLGSPVDVHIAARLAEVVSPDRIHVYRGFFAQTLAGLPPVKAAVVHIDCDLYQSTREVLEALFAKDVLQDGCVLLFDDYNCFRANPNFGERRAFREFLEGQQRFSSSPFFTYGFNGAAFFLHDLTVRPEGQ